MRRTDPLSAPARLCLAVLRNLAEDLGCTGLPGGVPQAGVGPAAREEAAARFVEGDCFAAVCTIADADPELWETLLLRRRRRALADATRRAAG